MRVAEITHDRPSDGWAEMLSVRPCGAESQPPKEYRKGNNRKRREHELHAYRSARTRLACVLTCLCVDCLHARI